MTDLFSPISNQRSLLACALAGSLALAGCGKSESPDAASTEAAPSSKTELKSGIDLTNFDKSVKPQDDLYRHVNGTWLEETEIPSDRSNYGSFSVLADEAELQLKTIIQESAAGNAPAGSDARKIGDMYASFMDVETVDAKGMDPLKADLAKIDAVKSYKAFPELFAYLSLRGAPITFGNYVNQDAKNPDVYIQYYRQGGTSLPDRDYYLEDTDKFKSVRAAYLKHLEAMLTLADQPEPAKTAKQIMALETSMAEVQWTKTESRDADKTYNNKTVEAMGKLMPNFDWAKYQTALGIEPQAVVIAQPSFFEALSKRMKSVPLDSWKRYLKWRLISAAAPYLSSEFVEENFAFFSTELRGTPQNRPRWKRAVALTEGTLGEVLAKLYVERHFPPEAKAKMEVLVGNLTKAYEQSIKELEWMTPATKDEALVKLSKFTTKIGYPDKWKDYSALTVEPDDLVGNIKRSTLVENRRSLDKLGQPIDRGEWFLTPQTVNAYYNPVANEIVFPAAILQPPFFDFDAEPAVNYGGIGAVIGHEIGHGFDDQGSKFNGDGELKNWWSDQDRAAFDKLGDALVKQYDAYSPVEGYNVNGRFTLGENIGDLGGISIAHKAYRLSLDGEPAPVIDGFTGDQRVFIGWAQVWRRLYREDALIDRLKTDPHAPSEYRANGAVVNVPAFHAAFGTEEGDGMWKAPEKRVEIW